MSERFLKQREVTEKTGLSRTEIYRRLDKGDFPKPVKLGPKTNAWLESEINAWMQALSNQRENN